MATDKDLKRKEILEKLKKMRNPSKSTSVDNKLNKDSIKKSEMVSVRRRDWATRENCR